MVTPVVPIWRSGPAQPASVTTRVAPPTRPGRPPPAPVGRRPPGPARHGRPGHQPGAASEHPGASARSMVAGSGRTGPGSRAPAADDAAVAGRSPSGQGHSTATGRGGGRRPGRRPDSGHQGGDGRRRSLDRHHHPAVHPEKLGSHPARRPARPRWPGQQRPVQRGGQPGRQIPAVRRGRQEHQRAPARGPAPAGRASPPGSVSVVGPPDPGGAGQAAAASAAPEPTTTA